MKFLTGLTLLSLSLSSMAGTTSAKKTLPISKTEKFVKAQDAKTKPAPKAEADCDAKAKKPIEIKPETISLSGNTGCSLDEVKH